MSGHGRRETGALRFPVLGVKMVIDTSEPAGSKPLTFPLLITREVVPPGRK